MVQISTGCRHNAWEYGYDGGDLNRQHHTLFIIVLSAAVALWWAPVGAEETHPETDTHAESADHHDDTGHHDDADHHGHSDHHFNNGLALFLGVTAEPGHGNEFTVGFEYARWLSPNWAIGGLIDRAGGDQRNYVLAPAVFWKPFGKGLLLLAAPGIEWHDGRGGEVDHHLKASEPEIDEDATYFVMRLGVGYSFHVGERYGLVPMVNLDLVDGHKVWVYGVNFEVMF